MLDEIDDVDWPGGRYLCSREGVQVVWQRRGMAQLKLDESLRWSRQSAAVRIRDECRDQYGCGEQRAAWMCAVVFRLGRVAHGKRLGSNRTCSARLE